MEFGYISFSNKEKQEINNVLMRLNAGAIDELGLGRIRDFFSGQMFPGMSTLHNRAKYFVLLPALYQQLSHSIKPGDSIPKKLKEWEINLTLSLLEWKKSVIEEGLDEDTNGITGSDMPVEELKKGRFINSTPTDIYLSSLRFFGLVRKESLIELIKIESERDINKKQTADEKREDGDSENAQSDGASVFKSCSEYNLEPGKPTSIPLMLTSLEAAFLKLRICTKCKNTLYEYLLENETIAIDKDFHKMKSNIDKLPAEQQPLKDIYDMAYDFSLWAQVVNTYYRYVFYKHLPNEEQSNKLHKIIQERLTVFPSKERISAILDYVSNHVNVNGLKDFSDNNYVIEFCKKVNEILRDESSASNLIDLIIKREQNIKGCHHKIGNDRYKNEDLSSEASLYTYRWNAIVYSMIRDIRNAK